MYVQKKAWYGISEIKPGEEYLVAKASKDGDFEQSYTIKVGKINLQCDCVAGLAGKYCRHQKMFHEFKAEGRLGKGWLYQFDTDTWKEPSHEQD